MIFVLAGGRPFGLTIGFVLPPLVGFGCPVSSSVAVSVELSGENILFDFESAVCFVDTF